MFTAENLALYLQQNQGFEFGAPEELDPYFDYQLYLDSSKMILLLGIIDLDKKNDRPEITIAQMQTLKEAFINVPSKLPRQLYIVFVGKNISDEFKQKWKSFKKNIFLPSKDFRYCVWFIDTSKKEISTNQFHFLKSIRGSFFKKWLDQKFETKHDYPPEFYFQKTPKPILTYALIVINIVIHFFNIRYDLIYVGGQSGLSVIDFGQWYRIFTAGFLHGSLIHILANMWALYIVGILLEPLIGFAWLGCVYFISLMGASALSLYFNDPNIYSLGASGAIMGLFGALLIVSMHFKKGRFKEALITQAIYAILPTLLLPWFMGLKNIDNMGHLGGVLTGAAMGLLLRALWPKDQLFPNGAKIALSIGVIGAAIVFTSFLQLYVNFTS